jgi:predicted DNA-binding transcriptional regulator AlpA
MSNELPDDLSTLPSLCRASEVATALRISKSAVWTMAAKGSFPSPRKLSARHAAWLRQDIEKWFLDLPRGNREETT